MPGRRVGWLRREGWLIMRRSVQQRALHAACCKRLPAGALVGKQCALARE